MFAHNNSFDAVLLVHTKADDWNVVVHAQRHRCRVHNVKPLIDNINVADKVVLLCVLVCFRRQYDFRPFTGLALAALIGTLGIVIWIAPGFLFGFFEMNQSVLKYLGFVHRLDGFNPSSVAAHNGSLYCAVVAMRFVRLVIVVPLAEEIFWRGFLMRYLTDPDGDFWQVPFGTHHWRSFVMVTAMFMLAHASVDYAPALVFGSLMYWLAVRTKSLSACVLAHAVANLILGVYVMVSQQWGYW